MSSGSPRTSPAATPAAESGAQDGTGAAPVATISGPSSGAADIVPEDWPGADKEPGESEALEGSKVRPCKAVREQEELKGRSTRTLAF